MEITKFLYDRLWEWLEGMNVNLGCFIIRWGLWMLIASGLLSFTWMTMHSRSRFFQILTFIIATISVFVLPLEYLKEINVLFGFAVVVCILAVLCLPPRVAFFLTPIRGQQMRIVWVIYGLEAVLFLIQLLVM